jgi:hypothetical protein
MNDQWVSDFPESHQEHDLPHQSRGGAEDRRGARLPLDLSCLHMDDASMGFDDPDLAMASMIAVVVWRARRFARRAPAGLTATTTSIYAVMFNFDPQVFWGPIMASTALMVIAPPVGLSHHNHRER